MDEKMDSFACTIVGLMTQMPDFTRKNWPANKRISPEDMLDGLTADDDLLMEQILDNMNSTPIGQVLKKIAALPNDSRQKVLRVRRELSQGRYNIDEHLDSALERALNDLDD
jgi:hypothetical protein